jgi:hypothetical protein
VARPVDALRQALVLDAGLDPLDLAQILQGDLRRVAHASASAMKRRMSFTLPATPRARSSACASHDSDQRR